MISNVIESTSSEGYKWCLGAIRQSVYAPLAMEIEMNKMIALLKQGDLTNATEVLISFNNKEGKVAGVAANNLAVLDLLKQESSTKLENAIQYSEQALSIDRYNANALVNRGNIFFVLGDMDKAVHYYREALSNEASCLQALYNLGYVQRLQGKLEAALECFYKLHNILLNNVEVVCQLAAIYESLEDTAQAIELYSQANNLAPTDPAILSKLANIYDAEGDKSQASQYYHDSYRYFPSNISTIEWLGAYYIDAQFPEKAANYFEKASIMEPHEIKWRLMMASCLRRSGMYQKAFESYREIHKRFPDNTECLFQFLSKAEKVRQLRIQREVDSSQGKRSATASQSGNNFPSITSRTLIKYVSISLLLIPGNLIHFYANTRIILNVLLGDGQSSSSRTTSSAQLIFDENEQFHVSHREMSDVVLTYTDPLGPPTSRPRTGMHQAENEITDTFEDEQFDESLLPE
ncbi:unnamed protein product [Thelazia callipaeda]|uniref:TPR_REGION domain-containing protein n=1 Tax=Thelazia callipaeda TaxID=103827 RepID=A0A0N5DBB6_THECL|nr:unnamed protein product [Thelazia callipaeda]